MAVQEVKLKFSCGPGASALSFCARWNFSVSGLHTSSAQWEYQLKYILFFFNFQECATIFVWNSDFGEDETLLSLSFCSFLNTGDSWNLATICCCCCFGICLCPSWSFQMWKEKWQKPMKNECFRGGTSWLDVGQTLLWVPLGISQRDLQTYILSQYHKNCSVA